MTLYAVLPSPGEGLGCFSTTPIRAGTLILTEKPLFTVLEPHTSSSVITAFSCLTSAQQQQYLTLHAVDPEARGSLLVADIFNSNAWQTESCTSLLVLAARFNHSCIPNATFAWNSRLSCATVHAIVAISANTQIYLSYTKPYQTLDSRRTKLSAYGFVCCCVACGSDSVESEMRRKRIVVLDARIRVERRQKWQKSMPKDAMELANLLKAEGLVGEALGLAYHDIAIGWRGCGRLDLATIYASKELDTCIMCFGMNSPYVDASKSLLHELIELTNLA
jgi:hypothetical protein